MALARHVARGRGNGAKELAPVRRRTRNQDNMGRNGEAAMAELGIDGKVVLGRSGAGLDLSLIHI